MELGYWKLVLLVCLIPCLLADVRVGVDSQNTSELVPKLSSQERRALQALWEAWRNNTPHPETNLHNWGSTSDPCTVDINMSWRGVRCTQITSSTGQEYSTVASLYLAESKLGGVLPFEISLLTNLNDLWLQTNNLIGQVPDVSNLTKLVEFSISKNNFTGPAPNFTTSPILEYLDLSNNNFTGPLPKITTLPGLQYLNLSNNNFMHSITNFSNLPLLKTLDLSNNNLTGPLPNLTTLPSLTILSLSSNLITSLSNNLSTSLTMLPETLSTLYLDKNIINILDIATFTNIYLSNISKSLEVLSIKDNMITKVVTTRNFFNGRETKIFLQGNPYCNIVWSSQDESTWCSIYCEHLCTYLPKANNNLKLIITASSSSFAIVLMLVILSFAFILRRNRKHIRHLQKQIKKADINTKWFEYSKLRAATKNFALEMKLGAGAYGAVYKGVLDNNIEVAVKQLFLETNKGKDDFLKEILLISNLQHQNLVTLKGYCLHGKQTLLVYEYVDNCDLDKLLFKTSHDNRSTNCSSNSNKQVLSWQARLKICQGVAQGLYYLHASSQSRIIHRDIKASNILLDKNLHPKIADFGLARPIEDAQSVILTQQCAGTFGYLAPEYMCHGQLSDKADVFSFGVLLLEIVSGKKNRDLTMPEDEVYLPTRAWRLYKDNKIIDLKDATLLVSDNEVLEVQRVLDVAMFCVQSAPKKRPSMYLVAAMLTGNANVDISLLDKNHSWPQNFVHE